MDGYPFAAHIRVRFADTDAQGVAHNSYYFIWFEVARVEYRGDLLQFRLQASSSADEDMTAIYELNEGVDELVGPLV